MSRAGSVIIAWDAHRTVTFAVCAIRKRAINEDRIKGPATNVGGKIKEGFGKLIGDEKLIVEGEAAQVRGKAENTVGGVKDNARNIVDGGNR